LRYCDENYRKQVSGFQRESSVFFRNKTEGDSVEKEKRKIKTDSESCFCAEKRLFLEET